MLSGSVFDIDADVEFLDLDVLELFISPTGKIQLTFTEAIK